MKHLKKQALGHAATIVGAMLALTVGAARADDTQSTIDETTLAIAPALQFGEPVSASALAGFRGGDSQVNENQLSATLGSNSASNLSTGMNSIADGSFGQASGFPMLIQNTGNNVIIQNSTILNLTVK